MRIGIDIQSTTGKPSGLGFYTSNLVTAIQQIDSENEYILIKNNFFCGNLSTPKRIFWEQVALPTQIFNKRIDVLHIPGFAPPLIRKSKLVVTLHDLIGIRMPENNLSPFSRFYWGKYLPGVTKTADIIITDSQHSRNDIVELLKVPEERVKVIYLAAGKEFYQINSKENLKKIKIKYGLDNCPYVLYVGNIEPRKNLVRLLDVWQNFPLPHKLVITGAKTKFSENLVKIIVEKKLGNKIIITNYIPTEELVLLYNGASLFVYPSLYEGFGLPVLDAMSCGVPVVTSNVTSLPEIVGDAGIMVNPTSIEELSNSIIKVLTSTALHKELSKKGLLQSKKFSWQKVAKETLDVYNDLPPKKWTH